ncbi:hypothetical protein C8F04DRAFT_1276685 [Mycena alexandri]|uniref:Uncharacterized protein n=1 Tax=Mycena alexandri TaxID=1745969 RepID=A0AAD6WPN7_9AGAR|nr:hypothetical protein C8F04DRAFT_1276685 [Mycena alexandri]
MSITSSALTAMTPETGIQIDVHPAVDSPVVKALGRWMVELLSRWLFQKSARPTWCLPCSQLPVEVWMLVLMEYCLSSTSVAGFCANRDFLRNLWIEFDVLLCSDASFWTRLSVSLASVPRSIELAVGNSRQRGLRLEIDLRSALADWEYDEDLDEDPEQRRLMRCLDSVRSASTRWLSIRCQVNRELYLEVLRIFLRGAIVPLLVFADLDSTVADAQRDMAICCGAFPSLEHLRVSAFPVYWMRDCVFPVITMLELRSLSPFHYPSIADLAALFRNLSATLKTLVLAGIGFSDYRLVAPAPFVMSTVEYIDLVFVFGNPLQDEKLVDFLSSIAFPALRSFRLENGDEDTSTMLAARFTYLQNITSFTVDAGVIRRAPALLLTRALSSLKLLNVESASVEFVEALTDGSELLEGLEVLRFNALDADSILKFLRGRAKLGMTPLRVLRCAHDPRVPLDGLQYDSIGHLRSLAEIFESSVLAVEAEESKQEQFVDFPESEVFLLP